MGEREEVGGGGSSQREKHPRREDPLATDFCRLAPVTAKITAFCHLIDFVSVASPDAELTENRGPCLFISEIVGDVA